MNYSITLSEPENLAMQYVANSVDDWIQNIVHERARIAKEDVIKLAIDKFLENNIQIPSTKDDIIIQAFKNGWIKTAKQQNEENEASLFDSFVNVSPSEPEDFPDNLNI